MYVCVSPRPRREQVRGMFTCNSMAHAFLVLEAVVQRFGADGRDTDHAKIVRSKNRYARPSGGGWMDCLINISVALPEGGECLCEVQIVHRQLLVVHTIQHTVYSI